MITEGQKLYDFYLEQIVKAKLPVEPWDGVSDEIKQFWESAARPVVPKWITELAQDCGIVGAPEKLLEFAIAVNNPATGEALYEIYTNSLHGQQLVFTEWEKLTDAQRAAWNATANEHRKDTPGPWGAVQARRATAFMHLEEITGSWQDGSDTPVRIHQDDACRVFIVEVGKNSFTAPSLTEALRLAASR